jgi:hypothetical protein
VTHDPGPALPTSLRTSTADGVRLADHDQTTDLRGSLRSGEPASWPAEDRGSYPHEVAGRRGAPAPDGGLPTDDAG